jgi:MFS family permease
MQRLIRYLYSSFRRCIQYGHAYCRPVSLCIFGVAVITCGGGSISDMLPPEKRGRAMAIWSVGPILGPVIGPGTSPYKEIISF